jgi:transposase-like protein
MLVELGVVEQRYRAVLEVLEDGVPVTKVARRYGVARQTVSEWLSRYASGGLGGRADRSSRPASCPHQMPVAASPLCVTSRPGSSARTAATTSPPPSAKPNTTKTWPMPCFASSQPSEQR